MYAYTEKKDILILTIYIYKEVFQTNRYVLNDIFLGFKKQSNN